MNKYGNNWCSFNGHSFQSRMECDYYRYYLYLLELAGAISELKFQVRYAMHGVDGAKVCDYIPDFEYLDKATGRLVVVDVKGVVTDGYNIKKKLFLSEYKHDKYGRKIEFQEVNKQAVNRAIKYASKR